MQPTTKLGRRRMNFPDSGRVRPIGRRELPYRSRTGYKRRQLQPHWAGRFGGWRELQAMWRRRHQAENR